MGPFPDPICQVGPSSFVYACQQPQAANYIGLGTFMAFGIMFASIAASSRTFAYEQVQQIIIINLHLYSIIYSLYSFSDIFIFAVQSIRAIKNE